MPKQHARKYSSPIREHKANITRCKIADAAERLLMDTGYDKMTVEAIAREAGVATQTVYAVYGSKRGIMAELLDRVIFGVERFHALHERAIATPDVREAVEVTVSLVRQAYESESPVYDLLRGAGVLAPELARIEQKREARRRDVHEEHVTAILSGKRLKPGMTLSKAKDIFWCLTSRDVYRMMIQEQGWTAEAYERWLSDVLTSSLIEPSSLATPGT